MKKLLRTSITSATEIDENLDSTIDDLKSNFDYAIDGFYKLARNGKEGANKATQIVLQLAESVENANKQIAGAISGSSTTNDGGQA